MSKISLTIDAGYCEGWGAWEGIRELISNAKDAEDMDPRHVMETHHSPKTARLTIRTRNVTIDPAALLVLGRSSKRGRDVRGRFGEGFVIGCLALTRAGHAVAFRNHDLSWRCVFEAADSDHPLAGNELLTFYSRSITRTEDFEVTIEGVTQDVWDALRPLFLFMTPPPPKETVKVDQGTLILTPDRKGMVFARGVFVRRFDNLECGYDLNEVRLDRDRQMIDEWTLHDTLSDLWQSVLARDSTSNDELARRAYDLVKGGSDETRHFRWRTDDKLVNTMRQQFTAEHGDEAVPVTTMSEARELETLGAKPVVVNDTLKELLAKTGLSAAGAKAEMEGRVTARLLPSQLDDAERAALAVADLVGCAYVVVEFNGKPACRPLDDNRVLGIDRRLLKQPAFDLVMQIAKGEGARTGQGEAGVLARALIGTEQGVLAIAAAEPSMMNKHHESSRSLYPGQDAEKTKVG